MIKFINRLFAPVSALLGRFYTLNEVFRLAFMLGMIFILFSPDYGAIQTMKYVMGVFLAITFLAHIARKYCLFNYIDMKVLYEQAKDHRNVAAALVFCAVAVVICTCIIVAAQFFVRS